MKAKFQLLILVLLIFILPQCSNRGKSKYSIRVVKPKYHHRWFDRKNDKRVKRTKMVKVQN